MRVPLAFTAPLLVLASACEVEDAGVREADLEAQARVYCDGQSCVNITPATGYTATSTGPGVVVRKGTDVVMKYDIDGSTMPAGPWVDTEWRTVDCHGNTVGLFATAAGIGVQTVNDLSFVIVDGGILAATVSSIVEFHTEEAYQEEPPE